MKPQHSPVQRIWKACLYSRDGLVAAIRTEAAFRQELALLFLALPVIFICPFSLEGKLFLFSAHAAILIVEIINSAIEAVVDLVAPEYNELAKKAKDMGSAAVFLTITTTLCLWLILLFNAFL